MALCEMAGGVAILVSPGVVHLKKYSDFIPLTIFSGCSLLGLLATFFLPETVGIKLVLLRRVPFLLQGRVQRKSALPIFQFLIIQEDLCHKRSKRLTVSMIIVNVVLLIAR